MTFTKVAPAGIGTSPGSTIRLGDSLLHSTGLDIGVGSGIGVTIRQHGDATFAGIITASAFFGDGSGLEGVSSSGIGTPLSDDDTSDLNKAYYVNQELSIGSTVTVNHPDSAVASYTHYQDLVVTDDADFIVADGDTFIPDILGINTSGLPSPRTGATGGRIRAGTITNAGANGAPNFPNGITVTGIITASTINSTSNQIVVGSAVTANSGGVDTVGVITASSFKGDGSQLTGVTSVGGATGVDFNDNIKVRFGTGNDFEIYFDGTNGNLKATTNVQNVNVWTQGTSKYQFTDSSFRPLSDNSYDLGTSSLRWRDVYTGDLNLSNKGRTNEVDNTWGDYTIQEGENDLFLINRRNGKKYKFLLQEVD